MATRPAARTAVTAPADAGRAAPAARPAPRPRVPGPPVLRLVRGPALLTLAVTLLRLLGELRGWSPSSFSTLPGGGLATVGITWLVPLVGIYLGWRLARLGFAPASFGRLLAWPCLALVAAPAVAWTLDRLARTTWTSAVAVWGLVSLGAAAVAFAAWPALGKALAAYALAARLPVIAVMGLAIHGRWGTHYDAAPPGFPPMPALQRWVFTGLVPQGTIWIGFTVAVGVLFGALGVLAAPRRAR